MSYNIRVKTREASLLKKILKMLNNILNSLENATPLCFRGLHLSIHNIVYIFDIAQLLLYPRILLHFFLLHHLQTY